VSALVVAIQVEVFKLRRTLALLAAVVVPLAILIMVGATVLSRDAGSRLPGNSPWDGLVVNFTFFLWCILALPLLITLEASLLAGLEHGQKHWKDLFALPIPRWSVYYAKLVTGGLLVALSLLVLAVGLGAEGLILNTVRPSLGLAPPVPWLDIFTDVARTFAASLLLLALITWIAVRWPSFAVPITIGLTGTVVGLTLDISARADFWARMFPWSMPLSAVAQIDQYRTFEDHVTAIALGVIGGLIVAVLGAWDITRRDVV